MVQKKRMIKSSLAVFIVISLLFAQITTVFASEVSIPGEGILESKESENNESADDVTGDNTFPETVLENTNTTPTVASENSPVLLKSRSMLRTNTLLRSGGLPSPDDSSYDARDYGLVTAVEKQKGGTCYIYSGVALAEAAILKALPDRYSADTLDIDEDAVFNNLYDVSPDPLGLIGNDHAVGDRDTGNQIDVVAKEFASHSTPVQKGGEAYYETAATLKEAFTVDVRNIDTQYIKSQILKYGAVGTGIQVDPEYRRTYIYYTYSTCQQLAYTAHAIALIGWDDSVPASLFTNEYGETPTCDGGWLFKNSWGPDRGDGGYFWLSYDDGSFQYKGAVHNYIDVMAFEAPNDWNVYQYDGGNIGGGVGAVNAANVYTAKANTGGTEKLTRIGAFLNSGEYTVNVYKYTNSSKAPWMQDTLLGTATLSVPERISGEGYVTAYFDTPIVLSYGDTFSVCIKKTDGSSFGIGKDAPDERNSVSAHGGESFLQKPSGDSFIDVTSDNTLKANLRIKAFTLNNNDGAFSTKTLGSVTVSDTPVYTGSAIVPESVIIKDTDGNEINRRYCNITCTNNINAGTATVTVTPKKNWIEGSVSTTFTISPKDMSQAVIEKTYDTLPYTGNALTPVIKVRFNGKELLSGTDYTVAYTNNINKGTATMTVTGNGNYCGSVTGTFRITAANGLEAVITCPASVEYTGDQIKPEITVKYNNITLSKGADYTVSYGQNTSPGTGRINVSFKENFEGEVTKYFNITRRKGTDCTVTYENTHEYTGDPITPAVTVSYRGTPLIKDSDYTVDYENNCDPTDTAVIRIAFIGLYGGSVTKYFSITGTDASELEIDSIEDDKYRMYYGGEYTLYAPDVRLKTGSTVLSRDVDYDISYRDNINAGTGYIVYTFKGRFYGKKEIPFTIYPRNLSETETDYNEDIYKYTGSPITPDISVKYGEQTLVRDTDYTVSYENNTEPGVATIKLTGKGNFTGTVTREFTIMGRNGENNSGDDSGKNDPDKPDDPNKPADNNSDDNKSSVSEDDSGNNDPDKPDDPNKPAEDNPEDKTSFDNGNDTSGTSEKTTEDPTVTKWDVGSGGYKAELSMKKEIPYTRDKRSIASACNVSFNLTEGSGITLKSVKAKKPKKGATSTYITIKLKGNDKMSKKAAKAMNRSLKKLQIRLVADSSEKK